MCLIMESCWSLATWRLCGDDKLKSNKFWIIVLGAIVIACAVAVMLLMQVPASYARIYKDGVVTETVNLAAVTNSYAFIVYGNAEIGGSDGFNILEVEHGRIRVSKADCADGDCIRMGWVSGGAIPIICLPNRLVVAFERGDSDVDAIVG